MILIGLGSNLHGPWGSPEETVRRALATLDKNGIKVKAVSPIVRTRPFGPQNQPGFANAVARIETHLPPEALLRRLHEIERAAGRRRAMRWGPRTLDLDLLDYHGLVRASGRGTKALILPHPGIAERIFVLVPIRATAPNWRHPQTHRSADQMLRALSGIRRGGELA